MGHGAAPLALVLAYVMHGATKKVKVTCSHVEHCPAALEGFKWRCRVYPCTNRGDMFFVLICCGQ